MRGGDLPGAILPIKLRQFLLILLRHLFRSGGGIVQIIGNLLRGLDTLGSAGFAIFKAKIAFRDRHAGGQPNQRANARADQRILAPIAATKSRSTCGTCCGAGQGTRRGSLVPTLRLLTHGLLLSRERLAARAHTGVLAGGQ